MRSRPAETGGAAAGVAVLIAKLLGANDPTTIASLAVVVGLVPAAITFLVELVRRKTTTPAPGAGSK